MGILPAGMVAPTGLPISFPPSLDIPTGSKSFGPPVPGATTGGEYQYFTEYADKKKEKLENTRTSIGTLGKLKPASMLSNLTAGTIADTVWKRVKDGPLAQLGQDYVAEQIAKNGKTIMNNLTTKIIPMDKIKGRILTPLQDANQMVFDGVIMAATAKNEVMMLFIRQTAIGARTALQQKLVILGLLQENMVKLNNALTILVAGSPFFSEYVVQLRKALVLLFEASTNLRYVGNTLMLKNKFLDRKFQEAITLMEDARKYLEPEIKDAPQALISGQIGNTKGGAALQKDKSQDGLGLNPLSAVGAAGSGVLGAAKKVTNSTLLSNVGLTTKPQQLTVILMIPFLVQETLANARGYFQATLKANALLLAFGLSFDELKSTSSAMTSKYAVDRIDNTKFALDYIIADMSLKLNGEEYALELKQGFKPNSIKVSASALAWNMGLAAIIELAKVTPTSGLKTLDASNLAVRKYQECVTALKTYDTVRSGNAVLSATDGRESYGELEIQLTTFSLKCLEAIAIASTTAAIKSLGRTIVARLGLSIEQDTKIIGTLNVFINAELNFTKEVKSLQKSMSKTLKVFGMDRASDKLNSGKFAEFFNLNAKTATYAGAAIVGLQTLKSCSQTTEQQAVLEKAVRTIEGENAKQKLFMQRTAAASYNSQDREIELKQKTITNLEDKANQAANAIKQDKKCSIPEDLNPVNKSFDTVFGVMGVNVFGSSTISSKMKTMGKGII